MNKLVSLQKAIELIKDNDLVALGGNVLHRAPMAACREMARQQKKGLRLIKTAGAMDVDILCLAGCAASVDAGFISYESEFGLAANYRKAVQEGRVAGNEHACYTVISALRAGSAGIPFMPVRGLQISDLIEVNDYFTKIQDPFSGEMVTVVRALAPDVAVIHVHEADVNGNAIIHGPKFEDVLMTRAAKKVIVTAETIVPDNRFAFAKEKADVPHFLVNAVVHVPKGAFPCDCPEKYGINREAIKAFKAIKTQEELSSYLERNEATDYQGRGGGVRAW
ncbi:MAG: CoA transferase subunit A [Lachnospiraceae bacterium]|nr:CoA transferase subunit A [Candidatus Equihabitans merdae]